MERAADALAELILAREVGRVVSAGPLLRRRQRSGELVRIRRGVYVDASVWATLEPYERYGALVRGTAWGCDSLPVLSHESAAAIWGLPLLGALPKDVHFLVERASGGRSDPGIRRHALGVDADDVTTVGGLLVTTLARTVVDLAASGSVYRAVAAADAAIHVDTYDPRPMLTKASLLAQWERMTPFRGCARARDLIDFSDERVGSPGESASRVSMAVAGFPAPDLQRHFVVNGRDAWADFYWEQADAVGEFDGEGKYLDARLRSGLPIERVILDEKYREDAIRRQVSGFTRWGLTEALSPQRLRVKLVELGLRAGRARLRGT